MKFCRAIFTEIVQFRLISCGDDKVQNCDYAHHRPNHHYVHSELSLLHLDNSTTIAGYDENSNENAPLK